MLERRVASQILMAERSKIRQEIQCRVWNLLTDEKQKSLVVYCITGDNIKVAV